MDCARRRTGSPGRAYTSRHLATGPSPRGSPPDKVSGPCLAPICTRTRSFGPWMLGCQARAWDVFDARREPQKTKTQRMFDIPLGPKALGAGSPLLRLLGAP